MINSLDVVYFKGEFKGKTIVCLICDSGLKYLSTDLWAPIGENGTGIN